MSGPHSRILSTRPTAGRQPPCNFRAGQYSSLLERALTKYQQRDLAGIGQDSVSQAIAVLLDMKRPAYSAVAGDLDTPAEPVSLEGVIDWSAQPLLGEMHQWFDMPNLGDFLLHYE